LTECATDKENARMMEYVMELQDHQKTKNTIMTKLLPVQNAQYQEIETSQSQTFSVMEKEHARMGSVQEVKDDQCKMICIPFKSYLIISTKTYLFLFHVIFDNSVRIIIIVD
jgi:hypothetical protein